MGLTDDRRMEQLLVKDHLESKSIKELIDVAEERSRKRYGTDWEKLSFSEKIPIVKAIFYSTGASPAQLSRSLGLMKDKVLWILGKD